MSRSSPSARTAWAVVTSSGVLEIDCGRGGVLRAKVLIGASTAARSACGLMPVSSIVLFLLLHCRKASSSVRHDRQPEVANLAELIVSAGIVAEEVQGSDRAEVGYETK